MLIIEVKKGDVFIPKFGGNKTLPEAEQIKVNHRYLTPNEYKKYVYTKNVKVDKLKGTVNSEVETVQDMTGIAKAIVTSIENYGLKIDGKNVMIDTIAKLYNTEGVSKDLINEIEINMFMASPEVDANFLE